MDCSPPGSSVHGIPQARTLERVAVPSSGDLAGPGIEPTALGSPALAGGFFTASGTWEALHVVEAQWRFLLKSKSFRLFYNCVSSLGLVFISFFFRGSRIRSVNRSVAKKKLAHTQKSHRCPLWCVQRRALPFLLPEATQHDGLVLCIAALPPEHHVPVRSPRASAMHSKPGESQPIVF